MSYSTKQRDELLKFFKSHPDQRFCAKQIAQNVQGVSLSAIYRNLARLEGDGAVQKFASQKHGEVVFQFVKAKPCENELHLNCTNCGKTFHMQNNLMNNFEQNLHASNGFVLNKNKTIVYGTCKECSNLKRKKEKLQ